MKSSICTIRVILHVLTTNISLDFLIYLSDLSGGYWLWLGTSLRCVILHIWPVFIFARISEYKVLYQHETAEIINMFSSIRFSSYQTPYLILFTDGISAIASQCAFNNYLFRSFHSFWRSQLFLCGIQIAYPRSRDSK